MSELKELLVYFLFQLYATEAMDENEYFNTVSLIENYYDVFTKKSPVLEIYLKDSDDRNITITLRDVLNQNSQNYLGLIIKNAFEMVIIYDQSSDKLYVHHFKLHTLSPYSNHNTGKINNDLLNIGNQIIDKTNLLTILKLLLCFYRNKFPKNKLQEALKQSQKIKTLLKASMIERLYENS